MRLVFITTETKIKKTVDNYQSQCLPQEGNYVHIDNECCGVVSNIEWNFSFYINNPTVTIFLKQD